ncbi:TIGR03862 family flavoprotein [Cohaesibacter celericrescens]|uniref:Aminoacetone oxidase family FAD-binding enzyme n=1 Tax=Cohaesibacter celericrescens TaxID=2067669 RepID=A0A2N5XR83_9HYPH|nr:TIGR03862 family flavoprotein [Cohaesibacter celericrescens]PLW77032.1 aminoacetone oxidase family FAD-binding enzyme [Cohaesibacter celericrescens]
MAQQQQKTVAIIGAGAAGLMAAERLSDIRPYLEITLYDAMPSPARKILMAGKSGLNISHTIGLKNPDRFAKNYGDAADWMAPMLADFGTKQVVSWMEGLRQFTYTGSSGRIFPKVMKASPLLRALMHRLDGRGVKLVTRHRWKGWNEQDQLLFDTPDGEAAIKADATLLALGGPSWPRLGTDGAFLPVLADKGIAVSPYRPANCGFDVDWPEEFVQEWAGHPIKSVNLSFGDQTVQGDFVITRHGIEGGAVYALSAQLRDAIEENGEAMLQVDLRPHHGHDDLLAKINQPRGKQTLANHLRKSLHLRGVKSALLKACTDKAVMTDSNKLAATLKALPIRLVRPRPLEEAISTAGGVALSELNDGLMVKQKPGLFIAGEMLDWEAPTGGYLLTACLSQGYRAAGGIAKYTLI